MTASEAAGARRQRHPASLRGTAGRDESAVGFGVSVIPGRRWDLSTQFVEQDRLRVWHDIDRLSLTWYSDFADITAGRQAITWGISNVYPVADLWAQFSPFELDTEEKPGIDAVRILKYPEGESHVIVEALKNVKPPLPLRETFIPLGGSRTVLQFEIFESEKKPHYMIAENQSKDYFVRVADKSIKASRELREIIKRKRLRKDIRFRYGDHEKLLMK